MSKRILDVVASAAALVMLFPLLVAVAVLIKLGSPGPVFYRGARAGKGGAPFRMFKFRTMLVNADRMGGPSTSADDPRLTRVGRFLRWYKLDELPQFISVLLGDMSLVGPRPEVLSETEKYTDEERALLSVQPGIIDYASMKFHNEEAILAGSADPHQTYLEKIRPEKVRLGLHYVRTRSFTGDLKILWQGFGQVLFTRFQKGTLE